MHRCLHSLLVGVLTFSLSVDAARACGHLRHWRACHPACAAPVVVVIADSVACGECVEPGCFPSRGFDGSDCGCGGPIVAGRLVVCEEIACGAAVECCGAVVDESVVASPAAAVETTRSPAPAAIVTPTPAPPAPSPVASVVPELEPVEPVVATEPAAEPIEPDLTMPAEDAVKVAPPQEVAVPPAAEPVAAEPETRVESPAEPEAPMPAADEPAAVPQQEPLAPPQPEQPAAPQPRNVFEEADAGAAADAPVPDEPAVDEMPAAAEPFDGGEAPGDAAEPAFDAGEVMDVPEVTEPAPDDPAASESEPSIEPVAEPEPTAAAEPLRRWIDDTASYVVVGRLVDIRGESVEILKADGRSVTVPLARLSGFDREYVAEVGTRVAAARQRGPHPRETAGR